MLRAIPLTLAGLLPSLLAAQTSAPARQTGTFQDPRLTESSAAVAGSRPGTFWTLNDSGNDPIIYLSDTTGAALGAWRVTGAGNTDWEALGAGRCGPRRCLYIGDTGDNRERRSTVRIYRVPEPSGGPAGRTGRTARADSLRFRYADGPHDVEALAVPAPDTILLITKGRSGGVWLFRLTGFHWNGRAAAVAQPVEQLPIAGGPGYVNQVTDASLDSTGTRLAVRTYGYLYFFIRGTQGLQPDPAHPVCDIRGLEPQGEGLAWWHPGNRLLLTSEQAGPLGRTIYLVSCSAP